MISKSVDILINFLGRYHIAIFYSSFNLSKDTDNDCFYESGILKSIKKDNLFVPGNKKLSETQHKKLGDTLTGKSLSACFLKYVGGGEKQIILR